MALLARGDLNAQITNRYGHLLQHVIDMFAYDTALARDEYTRITVIPHCIAEMRQRENLPYQPPANEVYLEKIAPLLDCLKALLKYEENGVEKLRITPRNEFGYDHLYEGVMRDVLKHEKFDIHKIDSINRGRSYYD